MEFRDQLRVLRAHARTIIACLVVAVAASLALTATLPKTWDADTKLIVGNAIGANNADYNALLLAQQLSQSYTLVATTTPVLEHVAQQLKLDVTPDDLRSHVSADAPRNLNIVEIHVSWSDANTAAAIANAVAAQLIATVSQAGGQSPDVQSFVSQELKSTQDQIDATRQQVNDLASNQNRTAQQDAQLANLQVSLVQLNQTYAALLNYASGGLANKLSVIEPAAIPDSPSSPRPLINLLAAVIVGLLGGVGLAFVHNQLDDSLKTPEQATSVLDLPTLGSIGKIDGLFGREPIYRVAMNVFPRSPAAEAFRMLRTNIEFASVDRPIRMISVTSALPEEGKTLVAANLAVAFAQAGRSTILVDADMRRPELHKLFGLAEVPGLTNLFRTTDPNVETVLQKTVEPRLRLLAAGTVPPNPAELLGSRAMADIVSRLAGLAEIVVFDTPPLAAVTDAAVLAASLDGTLLVANSRRTSRGAVQSAIDSLRRVGARVVGVVLNETNKQWIDAYGYFSEDAADGKAAPVDAPVGQSRTEHGYRTLADFRAGADQTPGPRAASDS